jgi:hypothetical protein
MKKVLLAAALVFCCCQFVCASTLFYNGDVDTVGLGALNNTVTAGGGGQMVFDDFVVPEGGWDISAVFSNNQVPDIPLPYTATGGTWEIWSDLDGAGQTLVASGSTTTDFSWTPTGRSGFFPEYTLLISGLNVDLAPGTYWLAVSPFISDSGYAEISSTEGQNAIGTPLGSNGMAYVGTPQGTDLVPSTDFIAGPVDDVSMGVDGTATPEPSPLLPLCAVAVAVCLIRRRLVLRQQRTQRG